MVPPHRSPRDCLKCGEWHSINEHRFHGMGSFKKTRGKKKKTA